MPETVEWRQSSVSSKPDLMLAKGLDEKLTKSIAIVQRRSSRGLLAFNEEEFVDSGLLQATEGHLELT